MQIKITTDRRPFVNEAAQPKGATVTTDKDTAEKMIDLGFAEKVGKRGD